MKVKKNDKVLMVTNPAPLLIFIGVINKLKKSNTYLIVHDVFPENALAGKLIPKGIVYTILKRIFSKAYAQFDNIIVLGEDMKEVIHNKISPFSNFSKLHVIQNWADTENLSNIITTKYNSFVDDRVHFLFAGNVGRLQRLEELIPLFGKYKRLITFTIIGSGALKLELEKMVEENNFDNIRFLDPLARSEQINFINSFDISVVSLEESMYGLGVPSKTYNIMACGKPILYIGPKNGEIDKLIQVYRIGWSFQTNSELESFLSTIDRMQITAISPNLIREIAVSMFSKKTIISKFLTVLQS